MQTGDDLEFTRVRTNQGKAALQCGAEGSGVECFKRELSA